MNRRPGSVIAPASEVVVHRFAVWEVVGQVLPATAGAEDVEDGVNDLADIHNTRATEFVSRQKLFEDLPLSLGQVARVGLAHEVGASERLV